MKELRADNRLLSRRGVGMTKHKRRILHILAITALAVSGFIAAGALAVTGYATEPTITTVTTQPPGNEGCTPGFWKNHPEAFAGTGFSPTTTLGSVFTGLSPTYASLTFDEALSLGGGGLNALLRQAVAALLNASSPDVDYPLSAAEVISLTNAAIASGDYEATKDLFDESNNLTAPGFCD
jgi:hypothetical protein